MMENRNKVSKILSFNLFFITTALIAIASHPTTKNPQTHAVLYLHEVEPVRSAGQATLQKMINGDNCIVIFYEDWCPPCKRMTPIFEEVAVEMSHITFIKLKRELYRSLFDSYNLKTVPAILFFKNGKLLKIQPSSVTKEKLFELIAKVY